MGRILRILKEKLRIPSWQALVHLLVAEFVLNFIWNWFSNMFEVVIIREIGFLVIFVATIFAVAWYLPKLAPVLYSFGAVKTKKTIITRPRLEHDGVLWEDNGSSAWGLVVIGPLCPNDYTPLARVRPDGKLDTHIQKDTLVSSSSKLMCPECKREFTLGKESKFLEYSENEVRSRFEGMRRRDQGS